MTILIFGITGLLGHTLFECLSKDFKVVGTRRRAKEGDRSNQIINFSEITSELEIRRVIDLAKPDVVINCIGVIKRHQLASEHIEFLEANALFPHLIAKVCNEKHVRLIHFSTDCVFSGKKGEYREDDCPDAYDFYGRSKLLGEIDYLENVLTIRTSIIGREIYNHYSLIDWFLAQSGKKIKGYEKAIFSGFPTRILAKILKDHILPNKSLSGIYHISSDPISKLDLLTMIRDRYQLDIKIEPSSDVIVNRSLNSDRFRSITGFKPLRWSEMIEEIGI